MYFFQGDKHIDKNETHTPGGPYQARSLHIAPETLILFVFLPLERTLLEKIELQWI